jgi:hypothetical protein
MTTEITERPPDELLTEDKEVLTEEIRREAEGRKGDMATSN